MYDIIFSDTARKQLKKLPKNIQKRIIAALERIRVRPEARVRRLVDDPGYKLRVGDYRVLLDIDRNQLLILIIKVGHRKNIYEK